MRRSNGQQSWATCPLLLTEFRRIGVSAGSGRSPDAGEGPDREGIPATQKSRGGRLGGAWTGLAFCNFCFVSPVPRTRGPDLNPGPVTRHLSHATPHLVHLAGACHLAPGTQHPAPSLQVSAISPQPSTLGLQPSAFNLQPSTPQTLSRNPPAAGTVRSGESRCRRVRRHRGWHSRVRRGAGSR